MHSEKPRHNMKNRTAFIFLAVLLLIAAVLVWLINPWSTTGGGLSSLLPQEPGKVTEIQVSSGLDTLVFTRADSAWYMDGEEMNSDAVENLLYASSQLAMRSILPFDEVKEIGPAVEVQFRKGKREAGHFFFAPSGPGYIVFTHGEEQCYGVELPGYSGLSLEKVFSGNSDHYRKHLLANLLPSEIASVHVEPREGTAFLALQDSVYNIRVLRVPGGENVTAEVDEHKVRMLFSYFNAIRYNRVAGPGDVVQETLPSEPWASVVVTTFDGVQRKFDIFRWVKPGEVVPDLFEALVIFNERPLLLVVNYYYLDLLVRGLEDYLQV